MGWYLNLSLCGMCRESATRVGILLDACGAEHAIYILRRRPAGLRVRYQPRCNSNCQLLRWKLEVEALHFIFSHFFPEFQLQCIVVLTSFKAILIILDIYDPEFAECFSKQSITKDFATSRWLTVLKHRQCKETSTERHLPPPYPYLTCAHCIINISLCILH